MPLNTYAQTQNTLAQSAVAEQSIELTDSEEVLIAFYKLAGVAPDYESVVKAGAYWQTLQEAGQATNEALHKQIERLKNAYHLFNPEIDTIEMDIFVHVLIPNNTTPNEAGFIEVEISPDDDAQAVLEYAVVKSGGLNFVVIPSEFERFRTIEITKDQLNRLLDLRPDTHKGYKSVETALHLSLKPIQSDAKTPMVLNNQPHWLIMGEIVSLDIWHPDARGLWTYKRDGHISRLEQELRELYIER